MKNLINNPYLKHPFVLLVLSMLLGAVGFLIKYYFFNDNFSTTKINQTSIQASSSNIAIGNYAPVNQNLTVNQIPKPIISLEKTRSATKITKVDILTAGLLGQYSTDYRLSIRSVQPIPRIILYTEGNERVLWWVMQVTDFNINLTKMTGPSRDFTINNANGDYIVGVASTSSNSIVLNYSVD